MKCFFDIKTKTIEDNIVSIQSQHIYAVDMESFINALMDVVSNTIFSSSLNYQVIFLDKYNIEYPIQYLGELRQQIKNYIGLYILDFSIKIKDDEGADVEIWVEEKEYKNTSSSAGTVPIKVIDVDNGDILMYYNEYTPVALFEIDYFVDMVNDFLEQGYMVLLNDIRLNDFNNLEIQLKKDGNDKVSIELEYENEENLKEKIMIYHEEYLHHGIEKMTYYERYEKMISSEFVK